MYNYAVIAATAQEILSRDGWNKGYLIVLPSETYTGAPLNSHCLGGALNIAMTGDWHWKYGDQDAGALYAETARIIRERFPARVTVFDHPGILDMNVIAMFNNHRDTTREEVASVLNSLGEKEMASVG